MTAGFVHSGIFVPVFNMTAGSEQFTFSPLGNAATKLVYWDEEAYVSELAVSAESPKAAPGTGDGQVPSASDLAAAAAEKEGLVEPGNEVEAKAKKRKADANAAGKPKKVCTVILSLSTKRLTGEDRTSTPSILEQSAR